MTCVGIILAAGASRRMNGANKQLISIGDVPVIIKSALNFQNCPAVSGIVIAARDEDCAVIEELCRKYGVTKLIKVCGGGETRFKSAEKAFGYADEADIIAVHDGARPFADPDLIARVIADAEKYKAAIAAVPVKDTIKAVQDGFIGSTPDRSTLFSAQTPQAFNAALYRQMVSLGAEATDDSQLAELLGVKVRITEGSYDNIKITTPEDVAVGAEIEKRRSRND